MGMLTLEYNTEQETDFVEKNAYCKMTYIINKEIILDVTLVQLKPSKTVCFAEKKKFPLSE